MAKIHHYNNAYGGGIININNMPLPSNDQLGGNIQGKKYG